MSGASLLAALYAGPVTERLEIARQLHNLLAPRLVEDRQFMARLERLRALAARLQRHMTAMDLGPLCGSCAATPGGGCCSLSMAGETDALQILMNLLAGVEVEQVRDDGRECVYLGSTGCIFLFKPMFCLNYNCHHIHRTASPEAIQELERLAGALLTEQYAIEQLLLSNLRLIENMG